MPGDSSHLQLRLVGGPADRHRVALNDLTTLASGIQTTVRNVGAVLAGHTTGRGGGKLGWIEQATELVLVAPPGQGSVTFELELAGDVPAVGVDPEDLGAEALAALVGGLDSLGHAETLPRGFDPGVLKWTEDPPDGLPPGRQAAVRGVRGGAQRVIVTCTV